MTPKNEANRYDKIFKENLEAVTPALVEKVLGIRVARSEKIQTDMPKTLERKPDQLLRITDMADNIFLLHLEFQVADEPGMVDRMLEYCALLRRKYKLPVRQHVFFLAERQPRMATRTADTNLSYAFDLIRLSQVDYNLFLSSNRPDEVVFSVLGRLGADDFQTAAHRIVQRLSETAPDKPDLERYLEQLRVLTNLRRLKPFIEQIMESVLKYFDPEIDPWYAKGKEDGKQEGKQEGKREGKQEGKREGRQEAKRELILKFLKDGLLTPSQIAFYFDVTLEYVEQVRAEATL